MIKNTSAYSKKYNYIMIYNAKSGCTLWRQLFLELHREEIKESTNLWHNINIDFPIPKNINNIPKIVVVRNPYMRVVSMFCNKYVNINRNFLYSKFNLPKITFREFVKKLVELKNKNKLNNTDVHIVEQTKDFIMDKNTYVVKLEKFNEQIIEAYKYIGKHKLLPQIEKFINSNNFINETKRDISIKNVSDKEYTVGNNIYPDYKYFYDNELLNMVYDLYKDDFIKFNYQKNII